MVGVAMSRVMQRQRQEHQVACLRKKRRTEMRPFHGPRVSDAVIMRRERELEEVEKAGE